jgi:IS605 OrfB family transposase
MSCNAIAKASQAIRALKHKREIVFKRGCSVHYDKRTYSLKGDILSLLTLRKRIQLKLQISPYHQKFLNQGKIKEAELVRKGHYYFFHLVFDFPNVPHVSSDNVLAVDFGENVLAATSTGKLFGGGALRAKRDYFLAHRKRLQGNGSQAAKQQLRYISGREKRAVRHVNHCVSKAIVSEAQENGCSTIILEDLKHIRERIKAGKKIRSRLHHWSFDQLRTYIEYKAQASGIKVVYVSPAYTSQTCSCCHNLGTRVKHRFSCSFCGSFQHSDLNASRNLVRLGLSADRLTGDVNHRHVAAFSGQ